jgi:hypothetical protein
LRYSVTGGVDSYVGMEYMIHILQLIWLDVEWTEEYDWAAPCAGGALRYSVIGGVDFYVGMEYMIHILQLIWLDVE